MTDESQLVKDLREVIVTKNKELRDKQDVIVKAEAIVQRLKNALRKVSLEAAKAIEE